MRYCKKKGSTYPAERKKKRSKPLNTLEQMYIIIGFAFLPLCSCMGNSVARSHVSLTSSVFSISSQQKLAPHWANPHFKALCLSTGDKAHSTHMEANSSLTLKSIASFTGLLAHCLVCFCDTEIWLFHTYSPHHPHHTDPAPNVNLVSLLCSCENICWVKEKKVLGERKVGMF